MKIVIATLLIAAGGLCWGSNRQMCLNPTFSKQEVAQYGQKAKGGHLPSMYFYSIALAKGRGVERDPGLSFKMANDAACRGFQPACYLVALRYNAGCGVEKDKGEAERWFLKFVSWAEKNNDRLSPIVLGNLAWCYLTGHGVKQDPTKAVSLFKQASDNGHLLSAANLGWCYMVGRGVAVDRQKAFHYFEDAALKGSDVAQWYLGLAYLDGMGTATNIIKGVEYLQKSVDSNNVADLVVFGTIYTAEDNKVCEAFALKDGKYVYVGDREGAEGYIERGVTKVIDNGDKGLVIPGCTEGHGHFIGIDGLVRNMPAYYVDFPKLYDISGRKGDVINVGGIKVSPSDVEETALAFEGIDDCICIAQEDKITGQALKLLVVLHPGVTLNVPQIREFLAARIETIKVPRFYEQVEKIERTYNGKIDRKVYRYQKCAR